jgi:hypothetical protein
MDPAAGGAGHNLIAVRSIGRLRIGQPYLNVHARFDASKDQLRHFLTLAPPLRHALTCLKGGMERRTLYSVGFSQSGNAAMRRVKHPPIRNKINTSDPAQLRAWTRRLRVPADDLKAIVEKVGNSVAAVSKEVDLQRLSRQPCPVPPIESSIPGEPAKVELATLA